jgi:raffinose/stachyose/melibiose transport system permease protein
MVEPKSKTAFYFTIFIIPCMVLYILFFIAPFIKGINISLTNWDGLTPKTPIIMEKKQFESLVLEKLKKKSDRDYVLKIYSLDPEDNSYKRIAVKGLERRKLERIFRKTKYEPAQNKFVGFENYKKVFTGKVDPDFYPRIYTQQKYTATSDLPSAITGKEFEKEVLKNCRTVEERTIIKNAYTFDSEQNSYVLNPEYDAFEITTPLYDMAESDDNNTFDESRLDSFISDIENSSLGRNKDKLAEEVDSFISENKLGGRSALTVKSTADSLYAAGELRNTLEKVWVVKQVNMGVTGFTIFFAIFSVIGINILAFALALALDTGIHGQKVLRSIFFLPNVLSMVIVALIWSLLFVQLLPAVSGVKEWISDPHKTPWLLVLVSVWQGCGYYMIVYLAGLQNIPTEIVEAAKIDGASAVQRFHYITMPMILPAVTISLFLSIANALKSFDLIYAMIGPTGYATGTVPFVMDIYFDAFAKKQAGMATAKAMVLFIAIFVLTGIQLFTMKRKEIEA